MQSKQCLLVVLLLCMTTSAFAVQKDDDPYLSQLIQKSIEKGLSKKRYWHLLLHYRRNLFGGYTSETDGAGFFLAPNGRRDPQAELEATLAKFFTDELVGKSRQYAQCAFPARYQWLKSELGFDDRLLPEEDCERFKSWIAAIDPQSVTLIFPSAYMNNPSSMFGHTLLRIDQKGQTEQTRLLAYAINYAADVTTENGIVFAVLGVTGGFEGYFSIMPYYLKVQEYSEMENRDIWEYRLNFNEEQTKRMLMHAWELGNTYFDYYFFKENCSYHLLSLLEIADPELHLTDQFWGWTIPADTVRLITEQPGLVVETAYRPSRSTQIRRKRDLLSDHERDILHRISKDTEITQSDDFKMLPTDRQAFLLDVAYDYMRYQSVTDDKNTAAYEKNQRSLLLTRSALKIQTEEVKIEPVTAPPEKGHRTARTGVGFGWRGGEPFEEVAIRPGYHDLLDDETGYTPDAQIEALSVRLRYYNHTDRIQLESLTLASIVSLFPIDSLFRKPSWKVSVGLNTIKDHIGCDFCNYWNFNVGTGGAIQTRFLHREVFYAFAELDANYGTVFEKNYRAGGGGTVGLLADITQRWKIYLFTTYLSLPLGERSRDFKVSLHQRYTLQKNLALRLELNRRDHQNEALIRLDAYF